MMCMARSTIEAIFAIPMRVIVILNSRILAEVPSKESPELVDFVLSIYGARIFGANRRYLYLGIAISA